MCSGAGLCLCEAAEEGWTTPCYKQFPENGDGSMGQGKGGIGMGTPFLNGYPFIVLILNHDCTTYFKTLN